MSSQSPYANLPIETLDQLFGFIEGIEGWGDYRNPLHNGALYVASGVPDIGYGFNLKDANSLSAVLDSLSVSSHAAINGVQQAFAGNIFQISAAISAARGQSIPTPQSIVSYFEGLIQGLVKEGASAEAYQAALNNALTDYVTGNTPTSGASPPATSNPIDFILTTSQAELAMQEFLEGGSYFESANSADPTGGNNLTILGKSPSIAALILAGYNSIAPNGEALPANSVIPGLDPASSQWQAVVAAAYLGMAAVSPAAIGKAMYLSDPAQVWYSLRYVAGGTSRAGGVIARDYIGASIFGLNGSQSNSYAQALLDYAVLWEHRNSIINQEAQNGANPDGAAPIDPIGLLTQAIDTPLGQSYGYTSTNAVLPAALQVDPPETLAATFNPEAELVTQQLNRSYSSVLPTLAVLNDPNDSNYSSDSFWVRSTDIFVAPSAADIAAGFASSSQELVTAEVGDIPNSVYPVTNLPGATLPGSASYDTTGMLADSSANHILIGVESGDSLVGGLGDDIIVAQSGSETLTSGAGNDTLIAADGDDTLIVGGISDVLDFVLPSTTGFIETVLDNGSFGIGSILVNGKQLGNGLTVTDGGSYWTDSEGNTYQFFASLFGAPSGYSPAEISQYVGELVIHTGSAIGDEIDIWGFNLQTAVQSGFNGVSIPQAVTLSPGSSAAASLEEPSSNSVTMTAGGSISFTASLLAPSSTAQTVTITLSGADSSQFSLQLSGASGSGTPGDAQQIHFVNGTATFQIAANTSSITATLVNTGDVGSNAALQLTATVGDPVTSNPLDINYVEPARDPFSQPSNDILYDDGPGSYNGTQFELYSQNGSQTQDGTPVSSAGSGNTFIAVSGVANDSVQGGSGNDTIYANFGAGIANGGTDVIEGEGGQDILYASNYTATSGGTGPASVWIYAGSAADLQAAIQNANANNATGQQGDLIVSQVANATIVGSTGNDLILDAGNDLVIAGPGNETIVGGATAANVSPPSGYNAVLSNPDEILPGITWVMSNQNGELSLTGGLAIVAYATTTPNGSEGNYDYLDDALGATNSTIYGGSGSDVIELSNGNNDVELGTGSSTVQGGMGSNTIIGGSGNNALFGGGGSDYITAGDGNSVLAGFGGNNTLIGGAGNDTLFAGSNFSNWATAETGNNYVQAGSGNALIAGSGGNDTLIGGSGNDTIQAGAGNESIVGGSGTELIEGGSGNDTIDVGGAGQDSVYAGSGNTTIYGGDGQDSLEGGSGTTVIYVGDGGTDGAPTYAVAGSGNTTIYGGDGVDQLVGGTGNDVIYVGDGGDTTTASTVYALNANATVYGGDGIDIINGGSGTDVLYAGDGGVEGCATAVNAGSGAATLYGGAGVSVLTDSVGGSDQLVGGDGTSDMYGIGNDTFIAGTGQALMSGTGDNTYLFNADGGYDEIANAGGTETLDFSYDDDPTDDAIVGAETLDDGAMALTISDGATTVLVDGGLTDANVASIEFGDSQSYSLVGLLQMAGAAGDAFDTVVAGSNGNLTFDTGSGDSVDGGAGQDTISAWGNNDVLTAGSGGTTIYAEGADATLVGGSGTDTLTALGANSVLQGGTGNETFEINNSSDVVTAVSGGLDTLITSVSYTLPTDVNVETATGTGNVVLRGNSDATNSITGNAGSDTLIAGSGQDTLTTGSGTATLVGGAGADTFVLNNSSDFIELGQGDTTIEFGAGITASDLTVSTVVDAQGNFALQISDGTKVYTLDDGQSGGRSEFGLPGETVSFQFAGSSAQITLAQLLAEAQVSDVSLAGSTGNLVVNSNAAATMMGGAGADTLLGTGADDTIYAGHGNQVLYGFGAGDEVLGGIGTDTLYGGQNTTFVAGGGDTAIYGGSGSNTYVLTAGGVSTISLADGETGVQTIELPVGMSVGDFTAVEGADGDLILESLSDSTTAVIKGFYNQPYPEGWFVTDSNGSFQQLLNLTSPPSSTGVSGQAAPYEAEVEALLPSSQANLLTTLNQIGIKGGTIAFPLWPSQANQFTFTGVTVDNLSVNGGVLAVGSSQSDQSQTTDTTTTETITVTTPIYSTRTTPASTQFVQTDSSDQSWMQQTFSLGGDTVGSPTTQDGVTGFFVQIPAQTTTYISGYQTTTETVPVVNTFTTETLGFTDYNVTGSGDNVTIVAGAPFVGTVVTGDGNNDSVYLGLGSSFWPTIDGFIYYSPQNPPGIGAFIDVGNGMNDTIVGTGGTDTITAGLGIDTIEASWGSTVYVPLADGAVDTINTENAPYYGNGPYAHTTLVLPDGVTPEDLQYRLFTGTVGDVNTSQYNGPGETLQLTYGGSTVLLDFDSGPPSWQANDTQSWDTDGINYFQFADGTVLTRAQVLALAGPAISSADYNPVVTQTAESALPGTAVAASSLFTAADASGSAITDYLISNNDPEGAYFTLNGQTYGNGAEFLVTADQLSQLQFFAGSIGTSPQFTVSAFDGLNWGTAQNISLIAGGPTIQATGAGQTVQATQIDATVVGSTAGADTLIGGFDGDWLDGLSGYDTFEYNAGGGAETIYFDEDANGNSDNILQFGPGITAASLTLSITSDDLLEINTGNPDDNVTMEAFWPEYPDVPPLGQFEFSDGTSLSLLQLLEQVQPSSGSVSEGSYTSTYSFNSPGGPVYSVQDTNASGQLMSITTIGADGNSDTKSYQYNSDGTEIIYENKTALDGTDLWDSETTLDTQGRVSNETIYPSDGSTISETYAYNTDGSYQETVVTTPADGGPSTTTVYNYDSSGNLITGNQAQASGADQTVTGSTSGPDTLTGGYAGDSLVGASGQDTFVYDADSGTETISETAPVSSTSANTLQFGTGITASAMSGSVNADGSVTLSTGSGGDSITIEGFNPLDPLGSMPIQQFEFADGSSLTFAQLLSQMQSSSTEEYVTNTDGTTTVYDFNTGWGPVYVGATLNVQGQLAQDYYLYADGSTETDSITYNTDGSSADTQVQTTAAGVATTTVVDSDAQGNETSSLTSYPGGSTDYVTYDSQGRHATEIETSSNGATADSTYSYNSDGSFTATTIDTPAGGGVPTTVVQGIDSEGNLVSSLQTNPDGSTEYDSWNDQGQHLSEVDTAADGSSNNTTFSYNADGSFITTEVETPAGGTPVTTEVVGYDSSGNELNDNSYTPGTNGSYTDGWSKPDGSYGGYWWNSSTDEYRASSTDANGTSWTDDYQYASGGAPGSSAVSFTETYSDGAGDEGTRQYNAVTGVTAVSWYSTATGTITGTVSDSGFIGLQNDGELTNTQPDLTFFNPATSSTFQNFLAAH